MTKYIIIVLICAAIAVFDAVNRSHSLVGFFSSALGGIAGLFAANMLPAMGTLVSTNLFSVSVCTVFGIPGLISLLLMRMICII